jgi:hypothetical protein
MESETHDPCAVGIKRASSSDLQTAKKLLKLSSSCNAHEALAAKRRLRRLAEKIEVDLETLERVEEQVCLPCGPYILRELSHPAARFSNNLARVCGNLDYSSGYHLQSQLTGRL